MKRLLFLFCCTCALASAQNPFIQIIEGDPDLHSSQLYSLEEDAVGNIWKGGTNGLFRFNGNKLKKYKLDSFRNKEMVYLERDPYFDRIWCVSFSSQLGYSKGDSVILSENQNAVQAHGCDNLKQTVFIT